MLRQTIYDQNGNALDAGEGEFKPGYCHREIVDGAKATVTRVHEVIDRGIGKGCLWRTLPETTTIRLAPDDIEPSHLRSPQVCGTPRRSTIRVGSTDI